jgi:hypothetical protein
LDKIVKIDNQRVEGKVLNDEQLVLLSSRPAVERSLADIEALKVQLEEVAKEQRESTSHSVEIGAGIKVVGTVEPPKQDAADAVPANPKNDIIESEPVGEEKSQQQEHVASSQPGSIVDAPVPPSASVVPSLAEVAGAAIADVILPPSAFLEVSPSVEVEASDDTHPTTSIVAPPMASITVPQPAAVSVTLPPPPNLSLPPTPALTTTTPTTTTTTSMIPVIEPNTSALVLQLAEAPIRKLLKALHVCARYEQCVRVSLPANVDFFGKSLLGQTSISSFSDTLETSLRSTGYYLNVRHTRSLCLILDANAPYW